jgi:hypothetical protein
MIIRENDEFTSCTITSVNDNGNAMVEYAPFKQALFPVSTIVVYEHESSLYYPISLEFRLIDNNILYMIKEIKINSMDKIFEVLSSSMEKEEKWSNVFKAVIVHLAHTPKYMYKLPNDFKVEKAQHIYELPK